MFDKRLMKVCPESRKYIIGNVLFQWLELVCNALVFYELSGIIAGLVGGSGFSLSDNAVKIAVVLSAVIIRFIATKFAAKMSFLASKTVKRKMRGMIYGKLLKLGSAYRESVTTAELVQESVEGVDQLETLTE